MGKRKDLSQFDEDSWLKALVGRFPACSGQDLSLYQEGTVGASDRLIDSHGERSSSFKQY